MRIIEANAFKMQCSVESLLLTQDELIFYFIKGAPAVVHDNVCTDLGIANGTSCTMHSLVLNPTIADIEWAKIDIAPPGSIHWLPAGELPLIVNVEFKQLQYQQWDPTLSASVTSVVLPMTLSDKSHLRTAKLGALFLAGCRFHSYWVELAFAVTFYKVQGCTVDRIILELNHPGGHSKQVDLGALYVGLSRVRQADHIRVLPMTQHTKQSLSALKFHPDLVKWSRR